MNDILDAIASWLASARSGVAFTGAGISTESGIPDFRGPDGFWKRNDQAKFTIQNYIRDPEHRIQRWRMAAERRSFMRSDVKPNAGHVALARLEALGCIRGVITQNIDGLHAEAGNENVLELHGNARRVACLSCRDSWPAPEILKRVQEGEEDPACTTCGGILKSATISFGQQLPADVIEESHRWSLQADCFLVVGSSLVVSPANSFPAIAKQRGAKLAIVNREPTDMDHIFDAAVLGDAGPTLSDIVERIEHVRTADG